MQFVEAVCINCGAILSLQAGLKTAFCAHCGSKISVDEAIEKLGEVHPEMLVKRETDDQQAPAEPLEEASPAEPEEDPLELLFAEAEQLLEAREYGKADEIYSGIVEQDSHSHRAWWGRFRCEERNFNFEEKILQTFSCFGFCGGSEKMVRDILDSQYLLNAIHTAQPSEGQQYFDMAKEHADHVFSYYSEGVSNLNNILNRRFSMLGGTWETLGIVCTASRAEMPTAVPVRYLGEKKYYFRFTTNRQGMLHLDVVHAWLDGESGMSAEHFRHLRMDPELGNLHWAEYRRFTHLEYLENIYSEFDIYLKTGYALCGLWHDRVIIRHNTSIYYCRMCTMPDQFVEALHHCYEMPSIPVVEDQNSYNVAKSASEFYLVQPIREVFESNQKAKWIKRKACYIATAVYGDYDAPQVRVLRRWRDEVLFYRRWGRAFIRVYYALSPPVARFLRGKESINRHIRRGLDWLVEKVRV